MSSVTRVASFARPKIAWMESDKARMRWKKLILKLRKAAM